MILTPVLKEPIMTDDNKQPEKPEKVDLNSLTDEELDKLKEEKIKKRIEELRKRDPFIYR
jgi:DNA uptake protein ComE-like DNA-binding protein